MNWIAVAGPIRAGKDTIGDYLVENHGYTKVSFAEPLKRMALAIDPLVMLDDMSKGKWIWRLADLVADRGWERVKDESSDARQFLQRLGTDGVRGIIGEDTWVEIAHRTAEAVDGPVVFCDTRFSNEADLIKAAGGSVWWVQRGPRPEVKHSSEGGLDAYPFDAMIHNNGSFEGLYANIEQRLEGIDRKIMESINRK